MAITDPTDLGNLVDWWDPADAAVSGSNVTAWAGANALSFSPAGTPTRVSAGQPGGSDSISVGSGNYLQISSANMVSGTTLTLVAAVVLGSFSVNGRVMSFATSGQADWNNAGSFVLHPYSATPQWPGGFRNNNPLPTDDYVTATTWHLLMVVFDGTDCTIWVAFEGESGWTQVATGGSTGTFDIDVITLGANPSGSDNNSCEFGDIALYSDAKGSTDRADLWAWFDDRAFGGGTVPKSSSDTGSGADSQSIAAAQTQTDTAAGAEGTPSIGRTQTDTGTGADAGTLAAAVAQTDTGSGADAQSTAAAVTQTETGAGADAQTIAVALPSTDTGAGAEGTPGVAQAQADTGSGTEGWSITVTISQTETGSGADGQSVDNGATPVSSSDTGSGTDAWSLQVAVSGQSDQMTAVDAWSLSVTLSGSETGGGTDDEDLQDGSAVPKSSSEVVVLTVQEEHWIRYGRRPTRLSTHLSRTTARQERRRTRPPLEDLP